MLCRSGVLPVMRPFLTALACLTALPAAAQTVPLGANLERFDYPAPVRWFEMNSQDRPVRMAYLDIAPTAAANGETVVLLHGKNFCAATGRNGEWACRRRLPGHRARSGRLLQILEARGLSVQLPRHGRADRRAA